MPSLSNVGSRRESWPPTQVRLVRSGSNKSAEPRPLLEDIDEDPLTYFLTPSVEEEINFDDDDDDAMDFDAGIEVAGRPRDITRSVSPSTLDGLRKISRRAPSPDFDSDDLTSDDDDGEDYIRFSPSPPPPPSAPVRTRSPNSLLSAMPRHSFGGFGFRSRSPVFGRSSDGFLSPASSFPAPSRPSASSTASVAAASLGAPRGRSTFASRRGRSPSSGGASARVVRPGHLWREPSADVWSIEEETEEELMMSEMLGSIAVRSDGGEATARRPRPSKPFKKVRFVLPDQE